MSQEKPPSPGRRRALKALGLLGLLPLGVLSSCGRQTASSRLVRERKLLLLGIDGLDARIAERMMARGELPSFRRLREMGGFRRLTSTIPPQSPTAWASVITGRDPGGHGIHDFVHRDPHTYGLLSGLASISPPKHTLPVGRWRLPVSNPEVTLTRRGTAFWDRLSSIGVPCEVYRVPSNFPPTDSGVRQLAGLGTPDARGSLGTSCYYSDAPPPSGNENVETYRVRVVNGAVRTLLQGPRNSLQEGKPVTTVDLTVYVDPRSRLGKICVGDQEIVLRQGEWSEWVPVRFDMVPHVKSVAGICRFYLKGVIPHFRLYVTAIHFDPLAPALPIAEPAGFATELAERHGRFHTCGLPEDTSALDVGVLDEDEYLHQAGICLEEARRAWRAALDDFDRGLLFGYFGYTDRNQHVFWRAQDPRHPAYSPELARKYGSVVEDCYRLGDELAGEALDACDNDTTLIVHSDHGFAPMYRRVFLNTWLANHGYLAMRDTSPEATLSTGADWSRTTAYALGLNAVYLNMRGREKLGVVPPEDRDRVLHYLTNQLLAIRDPQTGDRVFSSIARSDEVFTTTVPELAPDLILGYAPGYRVGGRSSLGLLTADVFRDNQGTWSGDHCIDRSAVPGIVFANRPLQAGSVGLPDITATALDAFDVTPPHDVQGKPLF